MYRLIDEYGNIIDELVNPTWLKQQRLVDRPISANSYNEADGVVLSDGETMAGIAGRNMENYPPLVTVEEVSGEPFIMRELNTLLTKGKEQGDLNEATQNLLLDTMSGMADLYETTLTNQEMQLDTMSGIAEMYEMVMTNKEGSK